MKDRLVTPSFCLLLAANFLLYFAFYLLMPVIPFYLKEAFGSKEGTIGLVLACYTLAALCVRPFSGYLLDTFARKPLYILSFIVFVAMFGGYIAAGTLGLFIAMRIVHGFSFGTVTVSGNTILIDITPSSRRGEAIGYYGLMNNLAMSFGPMTGMFLHDHNTYVTIFSYALFSGIAGLACAAFVKTKYKPQVRKEPLSLDRFFLVRGVPAGITLLLLSIPYGMTTSYVAMYAVNIGITTSSGLFFTLMAVGLAVSRMFSGRMVDRGKVNQVIKFGLYLACASFFALSACGTLFAHFPFATEIVFFSVAILLGVAFGSMFPAFNTMFVNLAPNSQRGTATSSYLTSWDVGIGIGLSMGGALAQHLSFDAAYLAGACLTILSIVYFTAQAGPFFEKYKLR